MEERVLMEGDAEYLEVVARLQPEELVAMRDVWRGKQVSKEHHWLVKVKSESPMAFMKLLTAAHKEWVEAIAKLEPIKKPGERDQGTEKALGLCEKALREAAWPSAEELARFMHETWEKQGPKHGMGTDHWENLPGLARACAVEVAKAVLERLR